jgi:O-antigen ligase
MLVLHKRARFIVFFTLVAMTLLVYPPFNDQLNVPKYSILFFAISISPIVLAYPKFGFLNIKTWRTWAPQVLFLLIMLTLILFSDHKNLVFFGNYGRNLGWFQYLGFAVLFLLTAYSFTFKTLVSFFHLFIILGITLALYGFLQYNRIDFISYVDTGFPVIATLGNSNFASAFIGLSSISLIWKITTLKDIKRKLLFVIILVFNIYVIVISKSTQGFFVLLIGTFLYLGIRFFTSRASLGFSYFALFSLSLLLGFLGLFQIGPLTKFVYQESTSYRGDYYRAAWNMFKSDPFKGVGVDAFGIYYRTFRDATAAMRLGPNITVDYAHNAPLQMLATGGVFLFLAYFICIFFVLMAVRKGFKKFKGEERFLFGAIVSIWLGYLMQEQVSPNQLTLAAFGSVISGAIVALGFNDNSIRIDSTRKISKFTRRQSPAPILLVNGITFLLVFLTFFILIPRWTAEINIRSAKLLSVSPTDLQGISYKEDLALTAVSMQPKEIQYHLLAADVFLTTGNMDGARLQLKKVLEINPNSDQSMVYLASLYEYSEEWNEAIKLRILASRVDPFNTKNYLQLGKDLAEIGDYQAISKVIELVAPLAGKSTIADDLKALLPTAPTS